MHNYNYNNNIHFVIDDNPDNTSSFSIAESYFRKKENFILNKFYPPFWDTGLMEFEIDNLCLRLVYHDMGGTELQISENFSKSDLSKVRNWAEEIYKAVNSSEI